MSISDDYTDSTGSDLIEQGVGLVARGLEDHPAVMTIAKKIEEYIRTGT